MNSLYSTCYCECGWKIVTPKAITTTCHNCKREVICGEGTSLPASPEKGCNGCQKPKDFPTCPHLDEDICNLASWLVDTPIATTPETCQACTRTTHPRDVNEVTRSLAGIDHSDSGVGTTLHNTITWFVRQPPNCGCADRVAVMNAWGPERCLKEMPTILGWLRESALDSGYPYSEYVIAAVVKQIIKRHLNE